MTEDREEPPSSTAQNSEQDSLSVTKDISTKPNGQNGNGHSNGTNGHKPGLLGWLKGGLKNQKADPSLRETIEEFIEESNSNQVEEDTLASLHEKTLISNVLKLSEKPVVDAMIPRADIVAISIDASNEELFTLLSDTQYSRIPVYKEKLDDVMGTVHIKDILSVLAQKKDLVLSELVREVPIIAPSMNVLDLLLEMRHTRKHMAMVVDEFGGIDGLV
ncbi:MAG: CBS domain-containing protein, partial [Alphaproteobacteria bacterium]